MADHGHVGPTLLDWIEGRGRGAISEIMRATRCAASTIHDYLNGTPIKNYPLALRISEATGGAVSALSLVDQETASRCAERYARIKGPGPRRRATEAA